MATTDGYVLLVDDEAHVTHIMSRRLRAEGFEVETARDGEEALELIAGGQPLCIVTDLQMPRMNGLELARALNENPDTSAIPLILLTARGYLLEDAGEMPTNVRKRVSKPFSAETLLSEIRGLLSSEDFTEVAA